MNGIEVKAGSGTKSVIPRIGEYVDVALSGTMDTLDGQPVYRMQRQGNAYLSARVDDEDMYMLNPYTTVAVEIEYWDEGTDGFSVFYSATQGGIEFGAETADRAFLGAHFKTDTKTWKTHTFFLPHAKIGGTVEGDVDIRIGLWDFTATKWTGDEVIVRDLRVKISEQHGASSLVNLSSDAIRNNFGADMQLILHPEFYNHTTYPISQEIKYTVKDSKNNIIWTGQDFAELKANETKQFTLSPDVGDRYDIFTLVMECVTWYQDTPETKYFSTFERPFSRSLTPPKDGKRRGVFGLMEAATRDAETVAVGAELGMWTARCEFDWVHGEISKGKYKVSEREHDYVEECFSNGMEPVLLVLCSKNGTEKPIIDMYGQDYTWEDEIIQDAFANYVRFIAEKYKGRTRYIEIMNEPNITNFNGVAMTPEQYGEVLIKCYKVIKEVDPNYCVIGFNTAEYQYEFCKRAFDIGCYDYFDIYSYHPYDWRGIYRWERFVEHVNNLKALMQKYGAPKPWLITELGFTSAGTPRPMNEEEQAAHIAMTQFFYDANDIDCLMLYCMYDRWDFTNREDGFGRLRWRGEEGRTIHHYKYEGDSPGIAKPSYLSQAAVTTLVGGANFQQVLNPGDYQYIFHYTDTEIGKDILAIQTSKIFGEDPITVLNLGCSMVDLYDMYGNKIGTLASDDGRYSLPISFVPYYVAGNFKNVELDGSAPLISVKNTRIQAPPDDVIRFYFTRTSMEHLTLVLPENIGCEVVENNGFSGAEAVLSVKVPEEKTKFDVAFVDERSNTRQICTLSIEPSELIKTGAIGEKASENSLLHWKVKINVDNLSYSKNVSGKVTITEPYELAEAVSVKTFEELAPRQSKILSFNLPARVIQKAVPLRYSIELDDGQSYSFSEELNFVTTVYAESKPLIDGTISQGEWRGGWNGAEEKDDIVNITDWGGPKDLSFSFLTMYDEENIYVLAVVQDNIHSVAYTPAQVSNMWMGDSLQLGFSPQVDVNPMMTEIFTELGFADVPGVGNTVYRYITANNDPINAIVETIDFVMKRYDDYTVYEARIPWNEIFDDDYTPNRGEKFRFSALINDNDGFGRRGWVEYGSGIGGKKDVSQFGIMELN